MVTTTVTSSASNMIQQSNTTSSSSSSSISPTPSTASSTENNNNNVSSSPARRVSDNRRSNKPIMEKRRRARINNCLNELKTLILDAMKKDPARHSKLEKADILEMTVKHLQDLQRIQVAMSAAADPSVVNKFRAGYSECATEVGRFPGLDMTVKRRLLQHLANCLNQGGTKSQEVPQQQVQVHILPNNNNNQKNLEQQVPQTTAVGGGIILSNGNGTGVQLVPTKLPNGDIALVLPTSLTSSSTMTATHAQIIQQQHVIAGGSPIPLLVPIVPERTPSTASATSSSSSTSHYLSPSHSPEPMDTNTSMYCQPKPLSLVVRKSSEPSEEQPWRPW